MSDLLIHKPHKLLSCLLRAFLWIFQKSFFFTTFFKVNQGLDNQVADINSRIARCFVCVIWLIVTHCAFGSFRLIELRFISRFFIRSFLWYFFAFPNQRNLIVNRTQSPLNLTWREVFAVLLLTGALLTEFLTAAACAFIELPFGRPGCGCNIFSGDGSFFINFLEDLIVDVFEIDSKSII